MYQWRKISELEREEILEDRRRNCCPWHRPPLWDSGCNYYLITAACYEHARVIGKSNDRMSWFYEELLNAVEEVARVHAWVVLPNHYHLLLFAESIQEVKTSLGKLHGRSSYRWNGEEGARGRKVWYAAAETVMKSERHFWATLNYIHNNPVKHGYVGKWQDWPWGSAGNFLEKMGRDEAKRIWRKYPVGKYGEEWDV